MHVENTFGGISAEMRQRFRIHELSMTRHCKRQDDSVLYGMRCRMGRIEVYQESFFEGAARARGVVVLIDVLRSYSTLAIILARGAEKVVLVDDVDDGLRLRDQGDVDLAIGGLRGERPSGYDFGNSPVEVHKVDLTGAKIAMRSSAGTRAVFRVREAECIYLGSFLTADATAKAVLCQTSSDRQITIVDLGFEGVIPATEDMLCSVYFQKLLEAFGRGEEYITCFPSILEVLSWPGVVHNFFTDDEIRMVLQLDLCDFSIRVKSEAGLMVARAEYPPQPKITRPRPRRERIWRSR